MLKDKDIRESLFDFLELKYHKARFYQEKMIGKSRADVFMVITEGLVGIEIKSDADTYTRLDGQIKDYDKYFDYNMVVVGSSHALHIEDHVPEHWGIITVDEVEGAPDFYILRQPTLNTKVKLDKKLELLWRPELAALLERFDMPSYKSQSKPFVRKKLIEWTKTPLANAEVTRIKRAAKEVGEEPVIPETKLDPMALNLEISELLFERDYEKLLSDIDEYRKENNPRKRGPKKSTSVRRVRRRSKK
ncbi:MAG: sce7726 family protein [Pseudobutyrivibrio sp.]|nr:sce7726 family protein [Pseudobutyrivibrio sp.]